jgi:hypothetical protein
MDGKVYKSYAELNRDLEILKLEKEIHAKKLSLSLNRTKELLSPEYLAMESVQALLPRLQSYSKNLLGFAFSIFISWLVKKFKS